MALDPVHAPTKSQVAYEALVRAIRDGRLRPGQRVTLQGLAGDFGMSLTPVREALRELAAQGLVEHTPNRGTVVAQYTLERAEEVYRLRLALEPLAARLAAEHADEADLRRVTEALDALDAALADGRTDRIPALNARLHRDINLAAHSPRLLEFIEQLWNGVPFQAISLAHRQERSALQHHAIVAAVREGRAEDAARAIEEHITEAAAETLRVLRQDSGPAPLVPRRTES